MDLEIDNIFEKLDSWMQFGYAAWRKNKRQHAREFWQMGWDLIVSLIAAGRFKTLEEIEKAFKGQHSIIGWAADYGELLIRAGLDKPSELPASINFNRQVLAMSSNPSDLNNQSRRRMIAESTFKTEGPTAGDAIYQAYLEENPGWGWGWASWADRYSFDNRVPWYDLERAETILRQALTVTELGSRNVVLERLRDVLYMQGRPAAASAIEI